MDLSTNQPGWVGIARGLLSALVPVVLILTSVRLLLTEAFVRIEYNMPGFPADPYGFTKGDRIGWASVALDYLLNDAGIDFLGDLTFEDGQPVYNQRELRHMADVKVVTRAALRVWVIGLALGVVAIGVLSLAADPILALEALRRGARWTLLLMLVLGVGLLLAFSFIFVGFHRIFFEGETWIFQFSDTLIRLFPERFWRDSFVLIAIGSLVQAGVILLISRVLLSRSAAGG